MKFYNLDTKLTFGKFKGKKLIEIIELQPSYIDWCAINLEHFYISNELIEEIKKIIPGFSITKEAMDILNKKYDSWENKQYDDGPRTYKDWLIDEFGDDADMVYWNLDCVQR